MIYAVKSKNIENVNLLLSHPKINVKCLNNVRNTPLHIAIENDDADMFETLMNDGRFDVNYPGLDGDTILHALSLHDMDPHPKILKRLSQYPDLRINALNDMDQTPLYVACRYRHLEVVKFLAKYDDLDVNLMSHYSFKRPLQISIMMGNYDIVKFIMAKLKGKLNMEYLTESEQKKIKEILEECNN